MVLDRLLLSVILMLSFASAAVAQREEPAPPPAAVVENDSRKAGEGGEGEKLKKLPGLTINREEGFVDLDAKVVLREGDWLELLACSPNSREHESIVTVSARPSHIHLSLLLLGAEAGKPMTWKRLDDQIITDPPRGPKIMAYFVLTENGKTKEIPVNEWVVDQETDKKLGDNVWLFTGSQLFEADDKTVYLADVNGTVMSLVNFGDDLLARSTDRTDQGATGFWKANTKEIPKVGTELKLRLKPEKENRKAKPRGATVSQEAEEGSVGVGPGSDGGSEQGSESGNSDAHGSTSEGSSKESAKDQEGS